jgi:hypothetical protein
VRVRLSSRVRWLAGGCAVVVMAFVWSCCFYYIPYPFLIREGFHSFCFAKMLSCVSVLLCLLLHDLCTCYHRKVLLARYEGHGITIDRTVDA